MSSLLIRNSGNGFGRVAHVSLSASASNPNPAPFSDYGIQIGESYPGFANLTGGYYPLAPAAGGGCTSAQEMTFYHDLIWSSSWYDWDTVYGPPTDDPDRWEVSLQWTGAFNPAPTVTVLPRRLQSFVVDQNSFYQWMNLDITTGQVVQGPSAPFAPDTWGQLRVNGVQLTPGGNRLIVVRVP